jgi:Holliday junction resolvase RusA-like endonuclease
VAQAEPLALAEPSGGYPARYMALAGKALKQQYYIEAKCQWKGEPLEGDVAVDIRLYFGTKRAADWDNFHKVSCDALSALRHSRAWTISRLSAP